MLEKLEQKQNYNKNLIFTPIFGGVNSTGRDVGVYVYMKNPLNFWQRIIQNFSRLLRNTLYNELQNILE